MADSLQKPTVAVIGYGSQGRAAALNLRDSGFPVLVGLRPGSKHQEPATQDDVRVESIAEAVRASNVIIFAFPDHRHSQTYRHEIQNHLRPGGTLVFLHGLSIHFRQVEPPPDVDVILIAPHGPGVAVREKFLANDRSMSAFVSVHQDHSGNASQTMFALAEGLGFDLKRLVPTTFEAESVGDMFGEQAVLCGGMAALIKAGFEVLVEKGISPENAYLEVAYQLDLIIALIKKHGIKGMFDRISVTARYGSLETGPELIDETVKAKMVRVFERIASGEFASRLEKLSDDKIKALDSALSRLTDPRLETAAKKFSSPD